MNRVVESGALEAAGRVFDLGVLSPAERRVLALALEGLSVREVTAALVVSEATVRSQLSSIYGKLGVRGRVELLARVAEASSQAAAPPHAGGDEVSPLAAHADSPPAEIGTPPESLAPILFALGAILLLTVLLPFVAIATLPGLLLAGVLCMRADRGTRQRRAAPWVFLAALLTTLGVLGASAAFVGVSSPSESEYFPTGATSPAESPGP